MEDPRSRAPLKEEWRDGKGEDGMEWISGWEERGREVKREVIWERMGEKMCGMWIGARGSCVMALGMDAPVQVIYMIRLQLVPVREFYMRIT